MMTCINAVEFVLISELEKYQSMLETRRLKNIVIFVQTILSFVLSRKIILQLQLYSGQLFSSLLSSEINWLLEKGQFPSFSFYNTRHALWTQ